MSRFESKRTAALLEAAACLLAVGLVTVPLQLRDAQAQEMGTPVLPEGFPVTIPLPDGFKPLTATLGAPPEQPSRTYLVAGTAPASVAELAAFYQAKLAKRGFEIVGVDAGAATVIRFFAVGLDAASVTLQGAEAPGSGTMVTISLVYSTE